MGGPFMMVPLETVGLNPWVKNSSFLYFCIHPKMRTEPAFETCHVFYPHFLSVVTIVRILKG